MLFTDVSSERAIKAFEKAFGKDLEFLKYAYGNRNLTLEEVEKVRGIIKKTGALEYSENLSRKYVERGKKFIPKITKDPYYQKLLIKLADLVIGRNN
ncbi:MAG: geranylgeranyl diphosphate synthase, type I [Parcubacteria group bacterium Gr01-1014_44]|nr:MAG: geranylgeranyl diphosphate synthase, type I [Parcubacteria group bacterium Gr01-1014_44]